MIEVDWLVAFAFSLIAGVATMGIGAFLLRQAGKDVLELVASLPTLSLKEDTSEARVTNRRNALCEMLVLFALRSGPGWLAVIFSASFLIWVCCKFSPHFSG